LKEIWAIRIRLQMAKNTRELALFNLAIDSKLRGCDLVKCELRAIAQEIPKKHSGGQFAKHMNHKAITRKHIRYRFIVQPDSIG
jgi:hypothetical protein